MRARAKGKSTKRPGMPSLGTSPGSPGSPGSGGEACSEGGGGEGRDDSALWEEATAMLRGELIRLGQEAAQKMEVGGG